jgi:hypothetical protein
MGASAVMARLGYLAYLAAVEAESLFISLLALLRVDLGSIEVHAIHVHYVNVFPFAALVVIVMVVAYVRLLHAFLVVHQLMNHLDPSSAVTMVRLGNLAGNQLLQVHRDPLFACSHTRGIVLIVHGG